jgi:CD109 antigen
VRSLFDSSFFDQSVDLNVNSKKHITLVHVDKAIYKPGDVVNFKIILLDLNLKPLLSKVNIFVTDGDDNFVKEFVKVDTVKGVFQNEIQLSDSPVMGRWKLKVKVLNTETDDDSDEVLHFFEVAEYIYPKFEVNVIAKPHITFSDEKVKVQILAKYENGENVKGEVTGVFAR